MSEDYRTYYVPEFLRGRPPKVIRHCMERRLKARKFSAEDVCDIDVNNGKFHVKSSSGKNYEVDFGVQSEWPSCDCQDWVRFHIPCKHFFAVFFKRERWQWNSLPSNYLLSAYLSQDSEALVKNRDDKTEKDQRVEEVAESGEDSYVCSQELPKKVKMNSSLAIII